ncbi:hypothetical protein A3C23_01470 [Candidatus Roizmanbacteria bacterium RIFCSPHIGHO2_02_FULL_37_13b]|uniref:Uncharacterized protein n=1 Tax=Candidatus Roizmanbacteria bacterium RIFCSPLOWO2_02_FULL_36_11 TaxID=1802071 RepID=A0A1F7JII4_9BACT|nr:MAG: hypothetical protein A3C23_01470 [Candidatus Roizmanbacteria bacterium RIFCSPHIGHO2_02_FULL_37_13b]OGK55407.1 MAG: hypothetical protein A3H78_05940 [Candidatus Roizmanbacteria bacterium RIFCSPLOWO2_02_FULL_36_11]
MVNIARGIIFVKRQDIDFYIENSTEVINLVLPAEINRDLEIIDFKKLAEVIKTFVETNKISTFNAIMIVDNDLIFEKDLINLTEEKKEEEIKKFLDLVPFDSVESRITPIDKGIKVLAINNNYFLLLSRILEKNGINTNSILTKNELSQLFTNENQLNLTATSQFFKQFDNYNQLSFSLTTNFLPDMENHTPEKKDSQIDEKPKRSYLPYLLIVFVLLFSVLIFFLFLR